MLLKKIPYLLWNAALVVDFVLVARVLRLFSRDPVRRRQLSIWNTQRISRKLLKSFHIKLQVKHPERLAALAKESYLLVANHSTYTDILLLSSLERLVFITSVEMGKNPFLGTITRLGGCLYTDRRKKVSLPAEIAKFSATIREGFKLVLFPEGTSTSGATICEFRKSLFQTAVDAHCQVLPVCIRYRRLDGQPITDANRDTISWYGDMTFLPHHWKLLAHRIEAELTILEPVPYDPQRSRGELSDLVHERLLQNFHSYHTQTI